MSSLMKMIDPIVGGLFGGLFGGADDKPVATPPPEFVPPPVMPTGDDEAVKRARKKSIAAQMARKGRASTILTQNDDAVGGALSGADNLGV